MFKKNPIEKEIDRLISLLEETDPTTEEYQEVRKHLHELTQAYSNQSEGKSSIMNGLSKLAVPLVVTASILFIEKDGIVTTKVADYVNKLSR